MRDILLEKKLMEMLNTRGSSPMAREKVSSCYGISVSSAVAVDNINWGPASNHDVVRLNISVKRPFHM